MESNLPPRRPLALVAAIAFAFALVLVAPVANASTTTTTTTEPAPPPLCGVAASDLVRVVTTDTPCTVATHVGASFEIVLRTGWRWGTPESNSKSVIVSHVAKSSMGVATAVLTATSAGVATIETAGTLYCAPGKVCPDLAILWTLQVIVTKSASAALTLNLTSADIDNTYRVRPGDRVNVSLTAAPKYTWSEPTVTESTVMRQILGRAGASANGLFVARSPGRTVLVATQKPNCGDCSLKSHRFTVNVVVTSRS